MGELKLLNKTAKLIAVGEFVSLVEIGLLVDNVMYYMLSTGNSFIQTKNLNVDIDLIEAKIKSFDVYNEAGEKIDLRIYTQKFSDQLIKNQKQGMRRLTDAVFEQKDSMSTHRVLIFGKN